MHAECSTMYCADGMVSSLCEKTKELSPTVSPYILLSTKVYTILLVTVESPNAGTWDLGGVS